MVNRYKIIYFGTPGFAVAPLEALLDHGYDVAVVVTVPGDSAVKEFAVEHNLDTFQPQSLKDDEFFEEFKNLEPDLCVVVSYGKIIPQRYLEVPKFGFLNIHPSLLPKYRGPSPVQAALLNGDSVTGVTIIKLDSEMDHGPIVAQQQAAIEVDDNFNTLIYKLFNIGAELLISTLPKYLNGEIELKEQEHDQATFSKLLKTEDAEIRLDDNVVTAVNKIKALNPEPGTYMQIQNSKIKMQNKTLRLKVLKAEKIEEFDSKKPILKLNDGYLLLKKVQPEGKKPMTGEEFMRGYGDYLELC